MKLDDTTNNVFEEEEETFFEDQDSNASSNVNNTERKAAETEMEAEDSNMSRLTSDDTIQEKQNPTYNETMMSPDTNRGSNKLQKRQADHSTFQETSKIHLLNKDLKKKSNKKKDITKESDNELTELTEISSLKCAIQADCQSINSKLKEVNKKLQHSHNELENEKSMKTNPEITYNKVKEDIIQTQQKVEELRDTNQFINMRVNEIHMALESNIKEKEKMIVENQKI